MNGTGGSSWIGIGISLVVVVIAALNLLLDFNFIEEGSNYGASQIYGMVWCFWIDSYTSLVVSRNSEIASKICK